MNLAYRNEWKIFPTFTERNYHSLRKYFLIGFLLCSFFASGQSWLWVKDGIVQPDTAFNNEAGCMTIDKSGNIYQAGYFQKPIVFGKDTLSPTARYEFFITKYNSKGNCIWAKQLHELKSGINAATVPYSEATDKSGNVYVVGVFRDEYLVVGKDTLSAAFDSAWVASEMFIIKLDSSGNFIWAKQSQVLSTNGDVVLSNTYIAIDEFQGVYVTGLFSGYYKFGHDSFNTVYPNQTMFMIKYDTSGNQKWFKVIPFVDWSFANPSFLEPGGITVDKWNNIYVEGDFNGQFSFNNDTIKAIVLSDPTNYIFLAKFDTGGNIKWVRQSTSGTSPSGYGWACGVTADKYGGVYITGYYQYTFAFGTHQIAAPTNNKLFYVKYDSSGNALWAKEPFVSDTNNWQWAGFSIKADTNNEVYLLTCGHNWNDYPSSTGICYLAFAKDTFTVNNPINDGGSILVKFDTSGNPLCGATINSGYYVYADCDPSGTNVYVGGSARKKLEFGADTVGIVSATTYPFLAKWNPDCSADGINKLVPESIKVILFPNPSDGVFTIASSVASRKSLVEIYNVMGQKVFSMGSEQWTMHNSSLSTVNSQFSIDLSNQPSGIYLYRVIDENGTLEGNGKFIIEK